ncbi:TetR/AcrR family transcriptional regulator [Actinoplanes sp. TFC3]|uniref:TetR/AcrR family transcriptional regulator n=1 Tax=Actinoplanes sp. TFC3 TaxID=1710355 RepID=UPI00082D0D80|nr:TetR/AcrR family transcriptional regulator [Actinoplanes sp. TFC3]
MPTTKTLRTGSAQKRDAILDAARRLFIGDGFDRTSVDAVAAGAGVSKRTVYDYFGDKVTLLAAVVESAGKTLVATIDRTLTETLGGVTEAERLEDALVAFAEQIATQTLGSAEYATLLRLAHGLISLEGEILADEPEEAVAQRLAELADAGLLTAPDPRLAADHLIALTFSVVGNRYHSDVTPEKARPLLVAGVQAFLRAYRREA